MAKIVDFDESMSGSDDEAHRYLTDRKFCPHCRDFVSLKTFACHKRLHFDQVSIFLPVIWFASNKVFAAIIINRPMTSGLRLQNMMRKLCPASLLQVLLQVSLWHLKKSVLLIPLQAHHHSAFWRIQLWKMRA